MPQKGIEKQKCARRAARLTHLLPLSWKEGGRKVKEELEELSRNEGARTEASGAFGMHVAEDFARWANASLGSSRDARLPQVATQIATNFFNAATGPKEALSRRKGGVVRRPQSVARRLEWRRRQQRRQRHSPASVERRVMRKGPVAAGRRAKRRQQAWKHSQAGTGGAATDDATFDVGAASRPSASGGKSQKRRRRRGGDHTPAVAVPRERVGQSPWWRESSMATDQQPEKI